MRRLRLLKVAMGLCLLICQTARSQYNNTGADYVLHVSSRYINNIQQQFSHLDDQLTKQTEKYLQRLERQEKKLQRKLSKVDSAAAQQLFANSRQQYDRLNKMIHDSASVVQRQGEYLPYVDSMKTSLSFLQQNNIVPDGAKDVQQKFQSSLNDANQLQSKLQKTEQVKAFIRERKEQIREVLNKYTTLPKGITNAFTDFNKQAYYYSQQLNEYKDMLKDPDRIIKQGLSLLDKLPAFQQFMQQHSELAGLFRLPDNYGSMQSLAGLQTRTQVQQQIQALLASGGPNAQQYLQQSLQSAQGQLNQLKDKLLKSPSAGDADMPNFKPNEQRTKTFWNRLEYGSNFQTTQSNYFFPTTSDLGLSVGYKLNNYSTIGVGASYKVGWGKDVRHISVTQEGMSLRSFADMKLKGSFYASGGFEYNYQPLSAVIPLAPSNVEGEQATAWQQSGLVGVSKIVSIKSNFFKKTKLQLLWDFLSYQQVPKGQPVKFRVGYNF